MADELAVGAVAERSGVPVSTLHFYEEKGLIASRRTSAGHRRYPRHVLRRLAFIRVAQRVGLSLEQIRAALDTLPHDQGPTQQDWQRLSAGWRPMLDERIHLLEALRDQLDSCIGCGCLSLETCGLRNPQDAAAQRGAGPHYLLDAAGVDDDRQTPPTGARRRAGRAG
ncbi:redox-sensitive transcriptional activator SoxR [Egicoccus sp. AB-alg2]|uniref:redox-sensitive transcriptional activator SoxR n=1 Tax=Egicoccus sp. AB-alg2 TaxID=3242693 RepID=UPI00359E4593